jgi:hypothetical protein
MYSNWSVFLGPWYSVAVTNHQSSPRKQLEFQVIALYEDEGDEETCRFGRLLKLTAKVPRPWQRKLFAAIVYIIKTGFHPPSPPWTGPGTLLFCRCDKMSSSASSAANTCCDWWRFVTGDISWGDDVLWLGTFCEVMFCEVTFCRGYPINFGT